MSQRTLTTSHPTANLIGGLSGTAAAVKFALGRGFGLLMQVFGLGIQFAEDLAVGGIDLSMGGSDMGLLRDGTMPKQIIRGWSGKKCNLEFLALIH
jgi:hypothetical protein